MSNFDGPYLQVLAPRTRDGINPIYDSKNRIEYDETHLPLTALKNMEQQNSKLPQQLQMIIKQMGK